MLRLLNQGMKDALYEAQNSFPSLYVFKTLCVETSHSLPPQTFNPSRSVGVATRGIFNLSSQQNRQTCGSLEPQLVSSKVFRLFPNF